MSHSISTLEILSTEIHKMFVTWSCVNYITVGSKDSICKSDLNFKEVDRIWKINYDLSRHKNLKSRAI